MHTSQLTLPALAWNEPAGHGWHFSAPSVGLAVLGAQSVAFTEPTEQKLPTGHTMHCSTDVSTARLALCRVPAGHGSGAADPSLQYDPGVHASQLTLPACDWYEPEGQGVHSAAPPAAIDPGTHTDGDVAPTTHAEPGGHATQLDWPAADW